MSARSRLLVAALVGLVAGGVVLAVGKAAFAPLVAWDSAALVYVMSEMFSVLRFDSNTTRSHALRENPGRGVADVLLLATSLASLTGVGVLILRASSAQGSEKGVDIALGLFSVVVSWAVVHTIFMLKYARLYYGDPEGGIDFNEQAKPCYADFAYLAFTVGMTFQVSDTEIQNKTIRSTVLKQALLAYVFGTVIIATTINTVVTLSSH